MTTTLETTNGTAAPAVLYEVSEAEIAEMKANYAAIEFTTKAGYETGVKAIAHCRGTRTAIEKRRKTLVADAVAWQRKVNDGAHRFTDLVEEIEGPLKAKKEAVDKAEEVARREAQEKASREEQAKLLADREAKEAELAKQREADEARLAQERRELEEQKAQLAEQRRKDDAARQKLAADLAAVAETNAQAERARAAFRAEQDAAAQAERDRIAAQEEQARELQRIEAARIAEAERQAEEAKRLEALKPDAEKLHDYAKKISRLIEAERPEVTTREARATLYKSDEDFDSGCAVLESFGK